LLKTNIQFIDPTIAEIMECVSAAFASISFIYNPIYFVASTTGAKHVAIFPAIFFKEIPGLVFRFT
jgi:hypothetical protein